ncbi:hypothetical protein C8F04DRAFT_1158877 [Mycena alexandri]|uniref:Uncharacterized protein n=1 Tax=Mycena alexandri TaxID=1745969 RepID=A0AAD6WLK6_9AGAR|nr:hypothetical protein C8F04DRAFT_1158877 [Mycena alexandri]
MAQVLAPFALPSVATAHPAIPANLVQAFGLDNTLAQGAVITTQAVQEADALVQSLQANKSLHPEFTADVVQTANDRAHMLSKIHAEVAFNDPNTLQNILATLQRLEASQARVEARLENAGIVKRNRLQLSNNSGSTVYIARRKQVAGDGLALATAVAPANVVVPALQGNSVVGAAFNPTIDVHTLNHAPILSLIRFYNEDFGITLQDTVPIRVQKVTNWLTEPMF